MRTLLDIQEDLLIDLLKETGTNVKKEAITIAIKAYLDMRRREKLAALIGNYEPGFGLKELDKMREDG